MLVKASAKLSVITRACGFEVVPVPKCGSPDASIETPARQAGIQRSLGTGRQHVSTTSQWQTHELVATAWMYLARVGYPNVMVGCNESDQARDECCALGPKVTRTVVRSGLIGINRVPKACQDAEVGGSALTGLPNTYQDAMVVAVSKWTRKPGWKPQGSSDNEPYVRIDW